MRVCWLPALSSLAVHYSWRASSLSTTTPEDLATAASTLSLHLLKLSLTAAMLECWVQVQFKFLLHVTQRNCYTNNVKRNYKVSVQIWCWFLSTSLEISTESAMNTQLFLCSVIIFSCYCSYKSSLML